MKIKRTGEITHKNCAAYTVGDDAFKRVEMPQDQTSIAVLGNLYMSEGKPGRVLEVKLKKRIADGNILTAMREAVTEGFPNQDMGQYNKNKTFVPSMIHSVRPTVPAVAITILK